MEKLQTLIRESKTFPEFIERVFKMDVPVVEVIKYTGDLHSYYHQQKRYNMYLLKSGRLN